MRTGPLLAGMVVVVWVAPVAAPPSGTHRQAGRATGGIAAGHDTANRVPTGTVGSERIGRLRRRMRTESSVGLAGYVDGLADVLGSLPPPGRPGVQRSTAADHHPSSTGRSAPAGARR